MPRHFSVVDAARVALFVLAIFATAEQVAAQEAACNDDIGEASSRLRYSYQSQLTRCMKFGAFATCEEAGFHVVEAQQDARRIITSPTGSCAQAVDEGVLLTDVGPGTCPPADAHCDERIGDITSLDDLAECVVCMQEGFDAAYRLQLDMPVTTPANVNERKCIRSVVGKSLKAIRAGIRDVERCARGGVSPFACAANDDPATKFGRAQTQVSNAIDRCKDASGQTGSVSGDSALLCHGTAPTASDLLACAQATARCLVCSHANGVYQQSQDCVMFAGIPCGVP